MNIEQIADAVSKEMLGNVANLQPELVKWNVEYIRRCLSKLAEQDVEPAGECGSMPGTDGFTMACFVSNIVPTGTKLYTETQLIAMQQRTAEACANLAANGVGTGTYNGCCPNTDWEDGQDAIASAIRNGEWRKYL